MEYSPLIAPIVALVAWTLIVMLWMLVARMGEFRRLGVTLGNIPNGARGVDLEGKAEASAQWKSHNYSHLMEQPTIFYAIVIALALMGMDQPINVWLAWGYVALRILHSLIQCTSNIVRFRLPIFGLASLCLFGLTIHAGARILHDCLGW
jgi:hypothetical protein